MPRVAVPLLKRHKVCDTDSKLTRLGVRELIAAGYNVFFRYVFFGPARPGDLDSGELDGILDEGGILCVVQHPPINPWFATLELGRDRVAVAISQCRRAGYVTPANALHPISLSSDMENLANVGPGPTGFQRAWCEGCYDATLHPVGYMGFKCGMTGADLDSMPHDPGWWADGADLKYRPAPPERYALKQRLSSKVVAGIEIDEDDVLIDGVIWGLADSDRLPNLLPLPIDSGDPASPLTNDPAA